MAQPQKPTQKAPEAACPHCGGGLAKSPMGQRALQQTAQRMAQPPRPAPQAGAGGMGGMMRPPMPQVAPTGQPDPRAAIRALLMQKLMQARQGGGGMPMRPPGA